MNKVTQKFEVVNKYYFRKDGVYLETAYDWIGNPCFGLYPVELDGKLGFANSEGEVVIPIIYDTKPHINGTALMINEDYLDLRINTMCGLVRRDGTIVIDFEWENMSIEKLSEGLLPVSKNGKWGFVNVNTGKVQIELLYDEIGLFKDGFASVSIDSKWGIIDKDGNIVIPLKYLLPSAFVDDFVILYEGGSVERVLHSKVLLESKCVLKNKGGYEIIGECESIERIRKNFFAVRQSVDDKSVRTLKRFILFPEYIAVVTGGEYQNGYLTPEGKYAGNNAYGNVFTPYAKYLGGGTLGVIDYTGEDAVLSVSELKKISEEVLKLI